MHFTIRTKHLLKALAHAQSIVDKKTSVSILAHVLLEAKAPGTLTMTATDLDLLITEIVPAEIIEEGKWCVPAHLFFDIVRRSVERETLDIQLCTSSHQLIVLCKDIELRIPVLNASDFPDISQTPLEHHFKLPANSLIKVIDETKFCMSEEETRFLLNGIYFYRDAQCALRCVTTDMHRLALSEITGKGEDNLPSVVVGRRIISELRKILEDNGEGVDIRLSPSRIVFAINQPNHNVMLSSRLINGVFPEYKRAFEITGTKRAVIDRTLLDKALDRVSVVVDSGTHAVQLSFSENSLMISSVRSKLGSAKESLAVQYNHDPITMQFNVFYLLDITRQLKNASLEFLMSETHSAILIKPLDAPTTQYVVMPIAA